MNVGFIPVRGGSKSIPLKNIKKIAGHPLVYWAAKAACECKDLDRVYVSTDHEEIKKTVENFKFEPDTDSVLSVVRQKRFFWKEEKGFVKPMNYDISARPMRQNFIGSMVENGTFYIT